MPISMVCAQCGAPAERCARCGGALCPRRLCAQLHDAACHALSALAEPAVQAAAEPRPARLANRVDSQHNNRPVQAVVERLMVSIARHRADGRAALVVGELDQAFTDLCAARELELQLDRLGPAAARALPDAWELETDLTPLARVLSARQHARASEAWRRVLENGPARSIQAEAAEWLAREAMIAGDVRLGLRILHARSRLGQTAEAAQTFALTCRRAGQTAQTFALGYRQAGLDAAAAFALYLVASRLDPGSARATGLRDPLTGQAWADQDPRWWRSPVSGSGFRRGREGEHRLEALSRARDLVQTRRDEGWWLLAEGDSLAGPLGARTLGRTIRAGSAEAADHDALVRIRLAYEGAAERLPDVAWPWYRLAELLAWSGFSERARAHLAQAERTQRETLRGLVQAALGGGPGAAPVLTAPRALTAPRPFPAQPFAPQRAWRLRLR